MGGVGGGKVVFSNLPTDVWLLAKEGELEVATLAADASQGDMAGVTVASGATLTLDAGVDLRTMPLDVRGVVGEESTTYGGDFGTSLDGLDGDGTVKVLSRTVTWTGAGADAKISTPANWQGGEAPLLRSGTQNAVFPADALRTDVTVDSDAYFDGVTLGGVSYSFTGPDSVFGVGTNGLSVAEPADAGGATYDFSVKIAQSGHGAWRMPTASTASKIYFRRPLVDGAAAGRIYTSGSKFYFHTTNSTYTGDVFVTNAVVNAVYAYGPAPFGTNGTLRVRSCSTSTAVLSLKDVQIHNNGQLDVAYDGRRRTLDFSGATNEFYGTFRNIVGASDNNYHKGVVIFHKGYGSSDKIGYVNWNGNIGSGEVHLMDKFYASTMEHGGINVHFHCASNYFSNHSGYSSIYSPNVEDTRYSFYADYAFYRTGYNMAASGIWNFHGTKQRVGSLYCDNSTLYLDSYDGPGHLYCCQTHYFSDLSKSRQGVVDYMFKGVFRGEMSFTLDEDSTRKLVMTGVSSATGTVEVAGGTLCFTNGASWTSATNVVVSGSGVLETYDAKTFGRYSDMRFSGTASWNGHGATQKVRFVYFDGVRQPLGTYCAEDYAGAASSMHRTAHVTGTGLIVSCGDGAGTTIILR